MSKNSAILVTCYVDPDLDGFAGAVAYAEFLCRQGREARAGILGEPHDEVKYVLARFNIPSPALIDSADDYEDVVLVDASDLNGLEGKIAPEKVIEIIDHRLINEADKFPRAQAQIEMVGAAATLVAEKFISSGAAISQESAYLLYGAIISNTLNFKGSVTTERDIAAARWLEKVIVVPPNYWRELFTAKSDLSGGKLAARLEGDFAWFLIGGKKIGIAQLEIIGAAELIRERGTEIISVLHAIKEKLALDFIFLNAIELERGGNFFLADDAVAQAILVKVLGVSFSGFTAFRDNLIMRKQIVPLLKAELEKDIL